MQTKLGGVVAAAAMVSATSLSPANAQSPIFVPSIKNPFGAAPLTIQSDYSWTSPAVGDLDNDGDVDILVSNSSSFKFYKNTGTNSAPEFTLQTGTNNPMDAFSTVYDYPALVLSDMDGDNDLDLLAGGSIYNTGQIITYYKNTGTASNPIFTEFSGTNSPIPAFSGYTGYGSPAVADIDGDGDKDVFFADGYYGTITFFRNTGSATNPVFTVATSGNPFPTGDVAPDSFGYLFPSFVDIDGDGDLDAILGQKNQPMIYYKNTGTSTAAVLTLQTGTNNPFAAFASNWDTNAFSDINNDGLIDLVLGGQYQTKAYFNSGTASSPKFTQPADYGQYARIRFVDLDGDGDQDALFSGVVTPTQFSKNIGTVSSPVFTPVSGTSNPFDNITSVYSNALADLDGDSDMDLAVGDYIGGITFYTNTGSSTSAQFTEATGTDNPFNGITSGSDAASILFVDLDNDGDQDLVSAGYNGSIYYFKNTGTSTSAVFTQQTGTNNPFDGVTSGAYNYLAFVNFDGDGDLDLLIGTGSDGLFYYENTGSASSASFTERTGTSNPFDFINSDYSTNSKYYGPAFMDFDADGDMDLFLAQHDGTVKLFENRTIVTSIFVPKSTNFGSPISAYPNPVKDVLNYSIDDAIGSTMQLSVLDMTGVEMLNETIVNDGSTKNVNVASLNPGIYMFRLSTDSKTAVVKFVKQ